MKIVVTDHAADRYIYRVKPHYTRDVARGEIQRLAQGVEAVPYVDYCDDREDFSAFIELAPGIAIALRADAGDRLTAVTTIIRTGARPGDVERRRRDKRKRKQRRRAQKRRENIARKRGEARPEED